MSKNDKNLVVVLNMIGSYESIVEKCWHPFVMVKKEVTIGDDKRMNLLQLLWVLQAALCKLQQTFT